VNKNPELTRIIDALNEPYTAPHMPGAIVAVVEGDEPVFLKGYGLANREFNAPWDPTVVYTFFSTTKSMTAAAVMTAQDRGLLSLDDEIQKYLPDFPRFPHKITIRELLNHTSGLWQDEELITYLGTGASTFPITNEEMYLLAKQQPVLSFVPGTSNYYNDAGMRYAARILEKATGKSFAEAMKELLFDPAGMSTARIKPYEPMWFDREAPAYDLDHTQQMYPHTGAVVVGIVMTETSGDGAASGSILDFIRYAQYLTRNQGQRKRLIERLTEPVYYRPGLLAAYRYGLRVQNYRGITVYEHGGYQGKEIAYLPEFDTWILIMRNALDYSRASMGEYLYRIVDGFCASDKRCSHYMSADNPLFEQTIQKPVDQKFSSEEFSLLDGTFIEPKSGLPIRFFRDQRRIRYHLLSTTADLVRAKAGEAHSYKTFENASQDLVQVYMNTSSQIPQISLLFADWGTPRKLVPAKNFDRRSTGTLEEYAGLYRSPTYGVVYDLRARNKRQLELRIGAGARFSDRLLLTRVAGDTFESAQEQKGYYLPIDPGVQFVRANNRITGMVINGNGVRGLRLDRLTAKPGQSF
jgi:CubicO group peptidase (beta-lactamase class C family)